jgi:hypothetical protein
MNGLPAIAQHLASQGRNGDSVLVHMTPGEVKGLQALAEQHGTSLTINPDTGLPEAFSLRNLLPMIAGAALAATGIGAPMAALMVGGGTAVGTGSIEKGLMAGLGAYGGGSLAGAAGLGAAAPTVAAPTATTAAGTAAPGAMATTPGGVLPFGDPGIDALQSAYASPPAMGPQLPPGGFVSGPNAAAINAQVTPYADPSNLMAGELGPVNTATTPSARAFIDVPAPQRPFMDRFAQAAAGDGAPSMYKTAIAGSGLVAPFYEPPKPFVPKEEEYNYEGPYTPSARQVSYPDEEFRRRRTSEFTYFTPSNPVPFQDGGDVGMNVTPAEADVYRNIANVQRMAGIPSIANMPLMVAPQRDTSNLVYNPIEYTPSEIPRREQNYGFAPLMTKEEAEKNVAASLRKDDGPGIFGGLFGGGDSNQEIIGYTANNEPIYSTRRVGYSDAGFKNGGVPILEDGGFVLTKKAVDGLGKGDNKKGQKVASRGLGAVPIKGPGTGTSDSIRTTIEGKQPALVSNGEAYVPKRQVERKGGAKKFYALMKAAERRA